jgi:signal transduction histidine kinase
LKERLAFLNGGGETGAQIRAYDWASTPLGPPAEWPQTLRTAVGLLIGAKQPVYVAWGPELTSLYNDGYIPILGTKHPRGIGQPFSVLWAEIWDSFRPIVEATMAGEAQHFVDLPIPLAGRPGVPVGYFTFSYTVLRDEAGKAHGFYCAATETTNQVLAEQKAKAERERLTQMFEQAPSFMAMLQGPDHRFELANPGYLKLVGGRDIVGKTVAEALPDAVEQGYLGLLDRVYRSGGAFVASGSRYEVQATPGGPVNERFVDFVFQPITDATGQVTGIFIVGSDVTARSRADIALRESEARLKLANATLEERVTQRTAELMAREEQLRQAQKMEAVGQLTGGLAHDFNNLLAGISGSIELMQKRIDQGRIGELGKYLNAAKDASARAASLTHRLLAFSRRQTLDPKPTNVNRLVAGMEDLIRRTVGPGIAMEVVAETSPWTTLVDPPQLENALLNLCINARDAMPDGGRLTVETANVILETHAARLLDIPAGNYVTLSVADTGTGMSPEIIARAFDPFFTTKPTGQGTGLGLSMIYGFARQSGGQVHIESKPGEGSTVRLYLPRDFAAMLDEPSAEDAVDAHALLSGKTVLLVDDEPTVRMLVMDALQELGCHAIEAADSVSGLRILQSDVGLDLLITDVGLPGGMNGRQLADAGRCIRRDLKVLFITGYAENALLGDGCIEPGMHVLTKPFGMDALSARINEIIFGR